MSESLADRAVVALADVKAIGANMDSEHPMRHVVRELKHSAERILSDAIQQATNIAYTAGHIVKDYGEATKGGK